MVLKLKDGYTEQIPRRRIKDSIFFIETLLSQAAYSIPKNQQINSIFNEKNPISPFIDKVLLFSTYFIVYIYPKEILKKLL